MAQVRTLKLSILVGLWTDDGFISTANQKKKGVNALGLMTCLFSWEALIGWVTLLRPIHHDSLHCVFIGTLS